MDIGKLVKGMFVKGIEGLINRSWPEYNKEGKELTRVLVFVYNAYNGQGVVDFLIPGKQNPEGFYIEAEVYRKPSNPLKHHSRRSYGKAIKFHIY